MRCPPRALNLVMDAMNAVPPGAVPCSRRPCVAEKSPLTNRVRRQFAGIKAGRAIAAKHSYRAKTAVAPRPAAPRTFKDETQGIWDRKSGNVGAIGRGDQAAYHSTSDLGLNAQTTGGFGLDDPPGAAIGHQGREHRVVQLVAAAHRAIGAEQRQSGQREIADNVENLVARTLVAVTQSLGVEQPGIVEHHRILERGAKREAGAPEPRDIVHASESPGAANLAAESFRAEIEHKALTADHGIGEVDFVLGAEPVRIGAQSAD